MDAISTLFGWFHKGGLIMWPILAFSIYGLALCVERWRFYRECEEEIRGS